MSAYHHFGETSRAGNLPGLASAYQFPHATEPETKSRPVFVPAPTPSIPSNLSMTPPLSTCRKYSMASLVDEAADSDHECFLSPVSAFAHFTSPNFVPPNSTLHRTAQMARPNVMSVRSIVEDEDEAKESKVGYGIPLRDEQKNIRQVRRDSERARRSSLQTGFSQLKTLLTGKSLSNGHRQYSAASFPNQISVLEFSADYVLQLQNEEREKLLVIENMKMEIEGLQKALDQ